MSADDPNGLTVCFSALSAPERLYTSNGGCRREEKSRKPWSLFTKLLSLVTANSFLLFRSNKEQLYVLIALKIKEKYN